MLRALHIPDIRGENGILFCENFLRHRMQDFVFLGSAKFDRPARGSSGAPTHAEDKIAHRWCAYAWQYALPGACLKGMHFARCEVAWRESAFRCLGLRPDLPSVPDACQRR